jgi:CRP-like cAMP-binding protein
MAQRPTGVVQPLPLEVVRPGRVAVTQGARGAGVRIVEHGILRATVVASDGRRLLLDVLGPGDAVGMPEGMDEPCEIRAAGPVRLRPAPDAQVQEALAARHRRDVRVALDLATLGAPDRIWSRMSDLADRLGRPVPGGLTIPVVLMQEDVAALAGTSRETVSRTVRRLVREGRLEVGRRGRWIVRRQLRLVR